MCRTSPETHRAQLSAKILLLTCIKNIMHWNGPLCHLAVLCCSCISVELYRVWLILCSTQRERMELGGFRCKFFFFSPHFALAFFPRHAHKHMQINTVPRPLSVSVDMSADSDSPPLPVSHLGTRAKKKRATETETCLIWLWRCLSPRSPLSLTSQFGDCMDCQSNPFCFCFFLKITLTEARFCSENPKAHYLLPVFSRFVSKKVATTTWKTLLCCWCLYRSCSALTSHWVSVCFLLTGSKADVTLFILMCDFFFIFILFFLSLAMSWNELNESSVGNKK